MARIFYGLSGEGRGHATRARAVLEHLRLDHRVTLFTYADAFDMLEPACRGTGVDVERIGGPRFHYRGGELDVLRTGIHGLKYATRVLPDLVDHLCDRIRAEKPKLVITDFEPALPRAARRCGVPFVSLTHQHALVVDDFSSLPARLRWYGDLLGLVVRAYYSGQVKTIVSSFYAPPLKAGFSGEAVQVGVLLRSEVLMAQPYCDGHLVAYLRRFASNGFLDALAGCGLPVRVYGLGEGPPRGNLTFRRVSADRFLEDLASCEALVSTAGNQLVGEALYLEKPVLAIPEPGNCEQLINAHFLKESGAGDWLPMEAVTPSNLRSFLDGLGLYRAAIRPEAVQGTSAALRALQPFLN